jgi:hypothetical protein
MVCFFVGPEFPLVWIDTLRNLAVTGLKNSLRDERGDVTPQPLKDEVKYL